MTDSVPDLAIVGAGIGGLTAALSLKRHGFSPVVYEQAAALGEVGAGITMGVEACRILVELGLQKELDELEDPMKHVGVLHFATAIRLNYELKDAEESRRQHGTAARHLHRADLHNLLLQSARAQGIAIETDCELTNLRQDADGVDLTFRSHRSERHELVIACDGLKSVARDLCFHTEAPTYTGMVAWRGLVDRDAVSHVEFDPQFAAVPAEDKLFARYPVRRGRLVNHVAIARKPEAKIESWTARAEVADVLEEFSGWHSDFLDVIAATPAERCMQWALRSRQPLDTWRNERVVLLGDAAHPMTPFYGMGAMMAMEDGFVLARSFAAHRGDWRQAFAGYENARLERANTLHLLSEARGNSYLSGDAKKRAQSLEAGLQKQPAYDALTVAV